MITSSSSAPKLEYFRELFNEIREAKIYVKKLFITDPTITSRIVYGRDSEFIPRSIVDYIEKTIIITYKWRFTIGKLRREYNINIGLRSEDSDIAEHYVRKIYSWLLVVDKYAKCDCSKRMDIYIYMTDLKKKLPDRLGQTIGVENVNTAFTTSCKDATEIHLFREEEWFKVLIHETFHNFGLDFSAVSKTKSQELMSRIFCVKTDFLLYESYTETLSEIIAVMFEKTPKWNNFRAQIMREQKFSIMQCCKILNYMGLSYKSLSCNDMGSGAVLLRKKYREDSAVFSYYIIKSILLFYIDEFSEWCNEYNENTLRFAGESKTQNAIVSFCDFIKKHHMGDEFLKEIDETEKQLSRKSIPRNYTSLRMQS
jgi:hypothetical protein